jgi:hypothetical protein
MTNTTPPPIPPKSPELAVLIAALTALVQAVGVLLVALSDVPAACASSSPAPSSSPRSRPAS